MKIRAELHINGEIRKPYLVSGPNELDEHCAHRLAAYILFWNENPLLDATNKTPGLANFEFLPDLIALNDAGEPTLWVECGTTTINKLTKITRRLPRARVVIIKQNVREARRLRDELDKEFDRPEKIEVLAWPDESYKEWIRIIADKNEVFGEANGHMMNIVLNETMLVVEFNLITKTP